MSSSTLNIQDSSTITQPANYAVFFKRTSDGKTAYWCKTPTHNENPTGIVDRQIHEAGKLAIIVSGLQQKIFDTYGTGYSSASDIPVIQAEGILEKNSPQWILFNDTLSFSVLSNSNAEVVDLTG